MQMDPSGDALLRRLAGMMTQPALTRAGRYFRLLKENNEMLLQGWDTVTTPQLDEKKDSRNYIMRLTRHVAETMLRDRGTLVVTDMKPPADEPDMRGVMFEIKFDDDGNRSEDREMGNILLRKIINNNIEMILTLGGKLRDTDAPVAIIAMVLQSVGRQEFTATGAMLAAQLQILRDAATAQGFTLDIDPPPLEAWMPPKGAAGH